MVLVDSSVWIRFLYGRDPYRGELKRLLEADRVAGHDLVYGELLIGDPGGREKWLAAYQMMRRVPAVAHSEVVSFVHARKLHGQGIGWIDAHLLASALVSQVPLWSADERLTEVARELRVEYVRTA